MGGERVFWNIHYRFATADGETFVPKVMNVRMIRRIVARVIASQPFDHAPFPGSLADVRFADGRHTVRLRAHLCFVFATAMQMRKDKLQMTSNELWIDGTA